MHNENERTPKEVYENLANKGAYEEAGLDKNEIDKIKKQAIQDYEFGKNLRKMQDSNWRVIFNIHYDALRELCDLVMRFKKQKTSNHQGVFAFIILEFPELELDWKFFETIRNIRNHNKYLGTDITKEIWKNAEFQIDLYILTIKKEIEKKLKEIG